jgi:hypothetical protein
MKTRRHLVFGLGLAAMAAPRAGLAQPAALSACIGWISVADPGIRVDEFRAGLRELGYVGPRELRIDVRIAQRDAPMKTTKALGVSLPQSLLLRANEVIQ